MRNITISIYWFTLLLIASSVLLTVSCKKDKVVYGEGRHLEFSLDTLKFDTLFVSLGSTTKRFTVRNKHNRTIEVSKIYLKGNDSPYRLTIDGEPSNQVEHVLIPANDSVYVFVEVTVDPNDESLPFVILDEVVFETEGNKKSVVLQSYGQNAHFYEGASIQTQTWNNDLPYVILNSLEVEEGHVLTIKEGVTVYFGGNSGMFINGTLHIEGGQDTTQWVTFRGYRLDKQANNVLYDQLPGQWLGVFIMRGSQNNRIENFRMRGSEYGLNIGTVNVEDLSSVSLSNAPDLRILNSAIYNSSMYGVYGFLAKIHATNLLIYNIGRNAIYTSLGGEYLIEHSTFHLRSSGFFDHKEPTLYMSDYHAYSQQVPPLQAPLNMTMINSVVDGTSNEEVLFDFLSEGNQVEIGFSSLKFSEPQPAEVILNNIFQNQDNGFENPSKSDFRLKEGSILIDKGENINVLFDIVGNPRSSPPDIGAFEL